MKNPEKVFCFKDNGVWTCCVKIFILRVEYVYSAVNVLTNGLIFQILLWQTFSSSIYPRFMEKYDNSSAVQI